MTRDALYAGKTRRKTWFALFPVTIGGETRWMENVCVEEKCYYTDNWHGSEERMKEKARSYLDGWDNSGTWAAYKTLEGQDLTPNPRGYHWVPVRFIDEEKDDE